MISKTAVIVANGDFPYQFLEEIKLSPFVVGVDRASLLLIKNKIIPDLVVGDMDSVTKTELAEIENSVKNVKLYDSEKDKTDTELAVSECESRGYAEIIVLGALGKRFDHALANIFLLEKFWQRVKIIVIDEHNRISILENEEIVLRDNKYQYFSFLSLTDNCVLTLSGFKYPLLEKKVFRGDTLCVSNELRSGKGKVQVRSGRVLMIRSSD